MWQGSSQKFRAPPVRGGRHPFEPLGLLNASGRSGNRPRWRRRCACRRYRLSDRSRPEVFIAEPVGSCTDLMATVTYPLRRLYGEDFTVAPVSVLVDPIRALRVFGLEQGGSFSEKVLYIYLKQLEEADLIVISKCDLLDGARLESLRAAIAARFPHKEILAVSARKGTGLEAWFDRIAREEQGGGRAMEVDYAVYADGEALLGWLNCTAQLKTPKVLDGDRFLRELASEMQTRLRAEGAEVAHLKMTLSPDPSIGRIGVVNLVRYDFVPELSMELGEPMMGGQLIINLRAEAAPAFLGRVVRQSLEAAASGFTKLEATLDHLEHFRPGKPTPTHRLTEVAA